MRYGSSQLQNLPDLHRLPVLPQDVCQLLTASPTVLRPFVRRLRAMEARGWAVRTDSHARLDGLAVGSAARAVGEVVARGAGESLFDHRC